MAKLSAVSKRTHPAFAPIHINWGLLESKRLVNLYKFGTLMLPGVPFHSMVKTLLDLESEVHRVFLKITEEERDRIRSGLKGLTLTVRIALEDDQAGEIVSVPLTIEPEAVLQRAILGKGQSPAYEKQMEELKRMIFQYVKDEVKKKLKETIERFLNRETLKARWKAAVKELVRLGAITQRGELAPETTIEDLLTGKYAPLFARAATKEVLNEGLVVQKTLTSLFEWAELDPEDWARETRQELALIGATLEALQR